MEFSHAGCEVAAICPRRGHPLLKTSSVQKTFHYRALGPLSSLTAAIQSFQPHLVVPCDDRAVQHLHELHDTGSAACPLIERSLGRPTSFSIVSNRLNFLEFARAQGLRTAETTAIDPALKVSPLPRPAPPWILKAEGSWGGHGVRIARGLYEVHESYQALRKPLSATRALKRLLAERDAFWLRTWWQHTPFDVIAQSYIPGRPANCAVFCWKGRVHAAIYAEVIRAQGVTGPATVVKIVNHPEMANAAEKIAARLDLSGFFGLDFVIEEGSGAAYLIEMNPRATPLCHLQPATGTTLPAALSAKLTGQPARPTAAAARKSTVAYFPQAWHWDPKCTFVASGFHDVPWEEPGLVRELLLLPWPERGALARILNRIRGNTAARRSSQGGVFMPSPDMRDQLISLGKAQPVLDESGAALPIRVPAVVPLRHTAEPGPLFLIHGSDGTIGNFHKLVNHLDPRLSVYGIQSQALLGEPTALSNVEEMAAYYLKELRALDVRGPYNFLGYSFGGIVAFEMARQFAAQGGERGMVGMIDNRRMSPSPDSGDSQARNPQMAAHLENLRGRNGFNYARTKLRARCLRYIYSLLQSFEQPVPRFLASAGDVNWFAARRYVPRVYPGRVTLFQTTESAGMPHNRWIRFSGKGTEVRVIPGGHENLFDEPQVQFLAREITECLQVQRVPEPVSHATLQHAPLLDASTILPGR